MSIIQEKKNNKYYKEFEIFSDIYVGRVGQIGNNISFTEIISNVQQIFD